MRFVADLITGYTAVTMTIKNLIEKKEKIRFEI
jgi:hypothetical protein